MSWTDERIAILRKLWEEGVTTVEIAKVLDVSKNSVVGKVHRLGLSGRPSPIKKSVTKVEGKVSKATKEEKTVKVEKETKKEKAINEKPVIVEEKTKEIKEVKKEKLEAKQKEEKVELKTKEEKADIKQNNEDRLVKLVDLDANSCRWPIGDPKDDNFHFCNKPVRVGQTYCDKHSEMAYVKQKK